MLCVGLWPDRSFLVVDEFERIVCHHALFHDVVCVLGKKLHRLFSHCDILHDSALFFETYHKS